METVVVTGVRESGGSAPYVTLVRRADHLITDVIVRDDTRDGPTRLKEMRDTLRALLRQAAADKTISLSVNKGNVLRDFTEALIDEVIYPDNRPDTSKAEIIAKTVIRADDTYDSATGRIAAFVKRAAKFGRSEVTHSENWELTIVGPQQYHSAVVAKIAQDTKDTLALFGPDYGVQLEGLYRPVEWYRAGQLDLALYIPYTYSIAPRRAN